MKQLILAIALLGTGASALAQDYSRGGDRGAQSVRTFETPRIGGLALDICPRDVGLAGLLRGRCDMPVATEFCQSRGFSDAVDAPQARGLGPTRFIRTGGIVEHPWATGFRYITCER